MTAPEEQAVFAGADRVLAFTESVQPAGADAKTSDPARWETWVTFRLGDEVFGLAVDAVREIVRVRIITRVPHAPHPVRGIINLRGRVVPTVDLRVRIGLPPVELTAQSRVIICRAGERVIGLLVDAAQHVIRLDRLKVEAPPADVMSAQSDYVLGVHVQDSAFVILLDADRVLLVPDELTNALPDHPTGRPDPSDPQQGTTDA